MGDLELFGQLPDAMLDRAAARGEFVIQFGWDADDFADRPFARFGGHFGEAGAQFRDRQGLDAGVVKLRCRDGGVVQGGAVERQPAWDAVSADRLHLVADHQVGVQVGIPRTRVAVIERRGDQSGGVDLGDTLGAHAGKRGVFFEKFEGLGHGLMVAILDDAGDRRRRDGPQSRHRFDRGKRQVVAGHGGGGRPGIAGDEAGEFAVICWWPTVGFGEHFPAQRRAYPCLDVVGDAGLGLVADGGVVVAVGLPQACDEPVFFVVDRKWAAQPSGGDRTGFADTEAGEMAGDSVGVGVQSLPEQRLHLVFADLRAVRYPP